MTQPPSEVTQLLIEWSSGDQAAFEKLVPLVHAELRRVARRYMVGERAAHTLQATALVNEAYLRLVDQNRIAWQGRAHFFAISAQMMRRILVDHARKRRYAKRGGEHALRVTLTDAVGLTDERAADVTALDDALKLLAQLDQRQSQVVELRFFGGLTNEETAEVLDLSLATIKREWATAKAWLYREMSSTTGEP